MFDIQKYLFSSVLPEKACFKHVPKEYCFFHTVLLLMLASFSPHILSLICAPFLCDLYMFLHITLKMHIFVSLEQARERKREREWMCSCVCSTERKEGSSWNKLLFFHHSYHSLIWLIHSSYLGTKKCMPKLNWSTKLIRMHANWLAICRPVFCLVLDDE